MTSAEAAQAGGRFARNSAYGTLAGALTALGSVVANVIVAQTLGVETTGIVAFALWVAAVAAAVADLGVQYSLARYLPELTALGRADEGRRLASLLWRWLAGSGVLAATGFAAAAWWRWRSGALSGADAALWSLVGLACMLQALAGVTFGYLRGVQRFDRLARITVMALVCQLAGVAFGCLRFGAIGALAGYCAGSAVPAVLSLRFASADRPPAAELRTRVRRYALYAWAAALSSTFVWSRAEQFFLQRSTGSAAVGLFAVGVTLANLAAQGPQLLTAGLLPHFAENFGKGAVVGMQETYAAATRVLAFLVFPACFGMAALLPKALPLIYGNAFAGAVPAATVLVLSAGVGATSSVGASLIMAIDRSDFVFLSGLVAALLSIAAGLTVIPHFGLIGAAWSRAAIQTAAVALGSGFVFWRLRFPLPLGDLARLLLAAALCGVAARATLAVAGGVGAMALAIAVGVLSYAVAVRVLGALCPQDANRLRALCQGLPAGLRAVCERAIGVLAPAPSPAIVVVSPSRSTGDGN